MPATLTGLKEVGLKEFPKWWTVALGLLTNNQLSVGPMQEGAARKSLSKHSTTLQGAPLTRDRFMAKESKLTRGVPHSEISLPPQLPDESKIARHALRTSTPAIPSKIDALASSVSLTEKRSLDQNVVSDNELEESNALPERLLDLD